MPPQVVVAGHICLDVIPRFMPRAGGLEALLAPGALVEVGPAVLSTGGAVSNTGLALHRLGVHTRLMGKIGDDLFGDAIRRIVGGHGAGLAEGLLVARGEPSSYTVVINPPGVDRVFLHCAGANDTFGADDVPYHELTGVRLLHFGYPPLMRRFYADRGDELATLLRRVRERGVATSLDMARPDPDAPSGRADWRAILAEALPHVDVFLPSFDETLYMLDPDGARLRPELGGRRPGPVEGPELHVPPEPDGPVLSRVSEELLGLGAAVVGLKLGDRGLYVRTTRDTGRLGGLWRALGAEPAGWVGRELLTPCYQVQVVGTTGCGDCTIAGFLAGLLAGLSLEETTKAAVATGACGAEQADATSGVPSWATLRARMAAGWRQHALAAPWPGWRVDAAAGLARGPADVGT